MTVRNGLLAACIIGIGFTVASLLCFTRFNGAFDAPPAIANSILTDRFYLNPIDERIKAVYAPPGESVHLVVHTMHGPVRETIRIKRAPLSWATGARFIGAFWLFAFAIVIVVRGASTREGNLLAILLLMQGYEAAFSRLQLPWPVATAISQGFVTGALWSGIYVVLAILAARTVDNRATRMAAIVTCILAFPCLIPDAITFTLALFPQAAWQAWLDAVPILPCFATGILAAMALRGPERQRLGWVFASFGLFWLVWIAGFVAIALGSTWAHWGDLENAGIFLIPLGLTYAAVSRRLFDLGFVLNRAAVFAGVSAIVVGAFVLLEWALGAWFERSGHETGLAVNAALALVLGLSLRVVHRRVDRVVDTVFFRKRHEDETALRAFAREAAFITDAPTLLERTRETILDHSDASSVSIVVPSGAELNDPAVLAMRASQDAVDLHGYKTRLAGEYAFPMLAHGAFLGVLVCGVKKSGERYAPDEVDALKTVAHGVGLALDGLTRESGWQSEFASLRDAIGAMQAAIVGRLDELGGASTSSA